MYLASDLFKHKINRKLTRIEYENRLHKNEKIPIQPCCDSTVIELNSNYMETIDWRFNFKGINSATSIAFSAVYVYFMCGIYISRKNTTEQMTSTAIPYLVPTLLICILIYLLCKEAFSYTHYPIRLDRKNRMIHVFRQDGSTLSAHWESIFFCMGRGHALQHEIQGHIFHEDTMIIRETFCFARIESNQSDNVLLLPYWEFVRRYMEEGPESIIEHVHYCPVIADRYENFYTYWQYLTYHIKDKPKIFRIIFFADLLFYPFRWFAMRTSKIPVWPQHIQQQCPVDPDDPYIRNASTNQA